MVKCDGPCLAAGIDTTEIKTARVREAARIEIGYYRVTGAEERVRTRTCWGKRTHKRETRPRARNTRQPRLVRPL